MRLGMAYPNIWGAIANHSGDAHFDFVYGAEWPAVLTHLQTFAAPALKPGKTRVKPQSSPGKTTAGCGDFWLTLQSVHPMARNL